MRKLTDITFPCKHIITLLVAIITTLSCILPMGAFPIWNGEIPGHRNQYELITEAFLEGRLDFGYGDEHELAGLENPYNPEARDEAGVTYHWDHAFYKGKYYMYFGVVPVFLVFMPFKLLTGTSLTTYHATQIFACIIVTGIFVLFNLLRKLFFKRLPHSMYLLMSSAVSIISVWYSAAEPALYCTAIVAAIALEIWSIYFFIQAVWGNDSENKRIVYAGIGALLGALVFGCRPPIGLANIVVIPMLYAFLRRSRPTWRLAGKLALAALPYALVAAGLMIYNYARFEDPLQFGQAYQITVADQSHYSYTSNGMNISHILKNMIINLFGIVLPDSTFPYLHFGGIFVNFPLLCTAFAAFKKPVRLGIKEYHLMPFIMGLFAAIAIITIADIMWSPYLLERYHMDIYFLAGIACYIGTGFLYQQAEKKQKAVRITTIALSIIAILTCVLFYFRKLEVYYPDTVNAIRHFIS